VDGFHSPPEVDGAPHQVLGVPCYRQDDEVLVKMGLTVLVGAMDVRHGKQLRRPPFASPFPGADKDSLRLHVIKNRIPHGLEQAKSKMGIHL
jgi:hypothetical protein